MVKVTEVKNSATDVNQKNKELTTVDENGKRYVLQRPSFLKGLNLLKSLGDLANNKAYYDQVYCLSWIKSIDDVPVVLNSQLEIDALCQRIDHEGIFAVREKIYETIEKMVENSQNENENAENFAKK